MQSQNDVKKSMICFFKFASNLFEFVRRQIDHEVDAVAAEEQRRQHPELVDLTSIRRCKTLSEQSKNTSHVNNIIICTYYIYIYMYFVVRCRIRKF